MKFTKATAEEKVTYHSACDYPLHGWIMIDGHRCAVEGLFEHNGPQYEVMAPDGYHFDDGLHSLICFDMAEVRERPAAFHLVRSAAA